MKKYPKLLKDSKYKDFKYLGLIKELKSEEWNWLEVNDACGVYMIIYQQSNKPIFLQEGTGGWFKGKDPNVSLERLNDNWVTFNSYEDKILYIGKAGGKKIKETLIGRIKLYMKFGNRYPVAHWGGRFIWQIDNVNKLEVYYKEDNDPRGEERKLIEYFQEKHSGRRPFANLQS